MKKMILASCVLAAAVFAAPEAAPEAAPAAEKAEAETAPESGDAPSETAEDIEAETEEGGKGMLPGRRLKKELATVRQVMVSYVHQIDSLNQTNKRLTAENKQVREQYAVVQQQAEELQQQNTHLTEKVTRASMLEITAFSVTPLNKRDRKTTNLNHMQKIQFDFTIGKNVTCERGIKQVYMRIVRPDGELINLPDPASRMFAFENSEIEYSLTKEFEYGGEAVSETLYWNVGEILYKGTYNADFFIDGALIASFPFELKH